MNPWGWQLVNGIWYKREDLYTEPVWGVNGSKFRTWQSVIHNIPFGKVVVAGSVHAPTIPAVAVAAQQAAGKGCTVIVGGTTPEKALRHRYIKIAAEAGAVITSIPVGYGPALKKAARDFHLDHPEHWNVHPENANPEAFLEPVGQQLLEIPELETLIVPFGSGNTTAGVLYGISQYARQKPKRVVLVGIGPDRSDFVRGLISAAGADEVFNDVETEIIQLHDWFARYSDRMPETLDGITFHPTYEGKVIRYLNTTESEWWTRRDGSTGFWIVGGPF